MNGRHDRSGDRTRGLPSQRLLDWVVDSRDVKWVGTTVVVVLMLAFGSIVRLVSMVLR